MQTNSQARISRYESPYFYYLRKALQVIAHFIECKTTNDVNFRLERSSEGKKIKDLVREVVARKLVYSQFCSQASHADIDQFVGKFEAHIRQPILLKELERIDLEKNSQWEPASFYQIESMIQIKTDFSLFAKNSARSGSLRDPPKEEDLSRLDLSRADPTPSSKPSDKPSHPVDWNLSNNFRTCLRFIENDPITKKVPPR